jgi:hypothetical protein
MATIATNISAAAPASPSFANDAWILGMMGCKHQPRDRMHQPSIAPARPEARLAAQRHRRFHVYEGERHEFGNAAGRHTCVADRNPSELIDHYSRHAI